MKSLFLLVVVALLHNAQSAGTEGINANDQTSTAAGDKELHMVCSSDAIVESTKWIDIKNKCVDLAKKQIRMEFEASLAYLQLGSHFSQYDRNRPGYAQFFFQSASEERQHAIKIFDYMLMRGQLTEFGDDIGLHTLIRDNTNSSTLMAVHNKLKDKNFEKGVDAFDLALQLEVSVTKSIKQMIKACEDEDDVTDGEKTNLRKDAEAVSANDYHMVDWLITDLLDEQLRGQRELAGRVFTLKKMVKEFGQISDFLYDKQLLEELNAKAA